MIRGEVLGSWVYRIAAEYGWSPHETTAFLRRAHESTSLDCYSAPPDVKYMARITLNSPIVISNALALETSLREASEAISPLADNADGSPVMRFCSLCLANDAIPYIRLRWALASSVFCPAHHALLTDRCQTCSSKPYFLNEYRVRLPSGTPRRDALRYCQACHSSLVEMTPASVPRQLLPTLGRFQQAVWDRVRMGRGQELINSSPGETQPSDQFSISWKRVVEYEEDWNGEAHETGTIRRIDWESIVGARHFECFLERLNGKLEP